MAWWWAAVAWADAPVLAPDRPGFGNQTATPGSGHVLVEGALVASIGAGDLWMGTERVRVRVGIGSAFEARLGLPDVVLPAGGVGPVALGGKFAGGIAPSWSVALVPEVLLPPTGGPVSGRLGATLAWALDPLSLWGQVTTTAGGGGTGVLAGGGARVPMGGGGAYLQAARDVGVDTMVGAGGWWQLDRRVQVDAGVDVWGWTGATRVEPKVGFAAVL